MDSAVAANLTRLSKLRPDIFSVDEKEAQKIIQTEKQRAREKETLVWDGHAVSAPVFEKMANQAVTFEEKVELYRQTLREEQKIGPKAPFINPEMAILLGEGIPAASGLKVSSCCFRDNI